MIVSSSAPPETALDDVAVPAAVAAVAAGRPLRPAFEIEPEKSKKRPFFCEISGASPAVASGEIAGVTRVTPRPRASRVPAGVASPS
jgi:hypothetical protein